jgi:hypothetical protein
MEAACYMETYLLTVLLSHDKRQVEWRLYSHNNRRVEWRLQYVAVMLERAKEIRLERRKPNKQVPDIYLIPPLSEIHNLIRPINVWQVTINITGFVVVCIKCMCFVVWLPSYSVFYLATQGDSGEKVTIFGGGSIGHCERKIRINMCLILIGYRDIAFWIYKYENIMNGNKEREITYW